MHIYTIYFAAILYNDNTPMKYIMNATMYIKHARFYVLLYTSMYTTI